MTNLQVLREETKYRRSKFSLSFFTALLTALATAVAGFYIPKQLSSRSEEPVVMMHVVNAKTNSPIPAARIWFEPKAGNQVGLLTNSMGYAMSRVPSGKYGEPLRVTAEAEGFETSTSYLVLAKDRPGTMLLVPREVVNETSQVPYTEIFRSGPRASGPRADFSGWYELAAAPPKPGFVIDPNQSSFELVGDRKCNAWSECVLSDKSDSSLVWRFRMQGHNENFSNSGIAYSEGILKVTYIPRKS
jgi:hypothetical protein